MNRNVRVLFLRSDIMLVAFFKHTTEQLFSENSVSCAILFISSLFVGNGTKLLESEKVVL